MWLEVLIIDSTAQYAMKKDPNSDLFWLELSGLIPEQIESYQYWVINNLWITKVS